MADLAPGMNIRLQDTDPFSIYGQQGRGLERIRAIVDSAPPAPQVFLVGDTVPAVTPVVNHVGGVWRHHADRVVKTGWAVELQLPDETDLQAAVDRARDERAIPEPTEGQNP